MRPLLANGQTYINVKGSWVCLYRAVEKHGNILDFMLSHRRNKPAATKFFARMPEVDGLPRKIVIDKSGANTAGIKAINKMLKGFGCPIPIEMIRRKHLNNIVEQDHRFIKRRTRLMLGFKAFASAALESSEASLVSGRSAGFWGSHHRHITSIVPPLAILIGPQAIYFSGICFGRD